ncbi:MAG: hypothetical protein MI725_06910 [Pirellulales bacterium]|nr:hypothetical protein [Pirellulales bacterium]
MKRIFACLLTIGLLCGNEPSAHSGMDETLLEDLGADLLQPAQAGKIAPLDERLLQQLGEDLELQHPVRNKQLSAVVAHMQAARSLLESLDKSSSASAAQEQALARLDAMIAALAEKKSQCRGGQCQKPSSPRPGKKAGNSNKAGTTAATAASAATTLAVDQSSALAAVGNLVKDLWGHLPERQREQILQPLSADFLPQYAAEIEAYFRDLAEP